MSSTKAVFERRNPVTGEVATTATAMSPDQARAAAEAAQAKAAARSAPPTAPTTARAEEEPVGRRSPVTSMLGALLDEVA